jgi:XTP/dITP diphosphohydrolase
MREKGMTDIIAASRNPKKILEMETITKEFGMSIISRDEAGLPTTEIEEDGATFEENSYKKAFEIMRLSGCPTIADDSGLEVDWLNGAPGIYSARFAGPECDDEANNQKLIAMLEGVPAEKRRARFVSVITMVFPDGTSLVARGETVGTILDAERGSGGFGYDPLFVPDGTNSTYSELTAEQKNQISHRGKALQKLKELLYQDSNRG